MENPLGVRSFQSRGDLQGRAHGFGLGHRAAERRAFDVLQHQIVRADVVDLANVGMIQSRDCPGFLLKSRAVVAFQPLDGNIAIQTRVSGPIYFSHSARANRREDLIWAEFVANSKGHVPDSTKSRAEARW